MTYASTSRAATLPPSLLPVALRDTALTVALLAADPAPQSFSAFRDKCKQQVRRLREEMQSAGHPQGVIEDAAYAQCALLDETALSNLRGDDRDAWQRLPLQVDEFHSNEAGHELIARIERRLAEPQPVLPLLAIFCAVLDLGFTGKFAFAGREARAALIKALSERLGRAQDTSSSIVIKAPGSTRWTERLTPLTWVVGACVFAAVVYVALDQWLNASVARIAH
ncbi:DotU family type IV/VI secretion system protein [bacterium M00.F.Ca.ET.228.01.1.1]|uniref:DotU family type IV/VI secretion system protein n=1 Tax=Paraburkholderia phenoliruptrix TaxID=252970 RepID=UPI00109300AC|nr:DotU/TssL family secretion system protein [Paraburkholderia phenoliruptrix]TGP42035.1 DotU family type IV/VI secretion system protein [bacterium M00.F.Ca.ET.228.01.1.1]TGR99466.1 DotU family type IV/VI secretion system protein [bacterium M00.F.Ca.ET.191.01.1.1]TGU03833.1 DotU family type IV/VI secretion system protein [bacterium M00.F.Ca.ET.155.01.1.1]MBW0448413.1 DotU family type IV/VI secretion system protein [Paraburkholderia phenoliruptrix]MBW9099624.1 DotU family type IV/VI secretion s